MSAPTEGVPRDSVAAMREAIVRAALMHVAFDGWSGAALRRGAVDAGYAAGDVLRAFPGGGPEAVELVSRIGDREMIAAMEAMDRDAMRTRERIATAVRLRLSRNAMNREAVRRGVALLALPQNAPLGARCLYRTVDAVWHAAGDRSTDWNFYSKRALLAAVYSATLLFWLDDTSEGSVETWAFLDRRIAQVMQAPKLTEKVSGTLRRVRSLFPGANLRARFEAASARARVQAPRGLR